MAVTLEWIRDRYDKDKSRRINSNEANSAEEEWHHGEITDEQLDAVFAAYYSQTLLPAYTTTAAKGTIVNSSYPTTATNGTLITIRAAVKNVGGESAQFKLAVYKGSSRAAQSSLHTVAAGSTGPTKTLSITVPSTGTAVTYTLKCIRVT